MTVFQNPKVPAAKTRVKSLLLFPPPVRWDVGHRVSCGLWAVRVVRRIGHDFPLETFDAFRALDTH